MGFDGEASAGRDLDVVMPVRRAMVFLVPVTWRVACRHEVNFGGQKVEPVAVEGTAREAKYGMQWIDWIVLTAYIAPPRDEVAGGGKF